MQQAEDRPVIATPWKRFRKIRTVRDQGIIKTLVYLCRIRGICRQRKYDELMNDQIFDEKPGKMRERFLPHGNRSKVLQGWRQVGMMGDLGVYVDSGK